MLQREYINIDRKIQIFTDVHGDVYGQNDCYYIHENVKPFLKFKFSLPDVKSIFSFANIQEKTHEFSTPLKMLAIFLQHTRV